MVAFGSLSRQQALLIVRCSPEGVEKLFVHRVSRSWRTTPACQMIWWAARSGGRSGWSWRGLRTSLCPATGSACPNLSACSSSGGHCTAGLDQWPPAPQCTQLKTPLPCLPYRTLRPDRLTAAMQRFVANTIGKEYTASQPFDLERSYAVSMSRGTCTARERSISI